MSNIDKEDNKFEYLFRFKTIILILVLGITFTVITVYPSSAPISAQLSSSNNNDFLNIALESLDSDPIYLEDYRGKIVVFEFMATWCLTCAQQEPILQELFLKYQNDDVVVLAVSIDPTYDTNDVIKNFIDKKDIPWQITRDTSLMMTRFFQISEISSILIISPEGEVENEFTGLTDLDTLSKAIDILL